MFKTGRNPVTLNQTKENRTVAGVLSDLLSALLAFLLEFVQIGPDDSEELKYNGGADVRHDAESENGEALESATAEQVEPSEDRSLHVLKHLLKRRTVHARSRNMNRRFGRQPAS